jgi:threonyl-tRNA synthetase
MSQAVKAATTKKAAPLCENGYPLEMDPQPAFIQARIAMFERLKAEQDAFVAAQPRVPIEVRLADGRVYAGPDVLAWQTTPVDVCKALYPGLLDALVVAKVDGQLWDSTRPLERSCALALLDFDDPEGQQVFWHSSAHMLGEACERHYGCHLCLGPPLEDGFYYEMDTALVGRTVSQSDYAPLEAIAKAVGKEKQRFERLVMTKAQLLEMFAYNPFKVEFIREKVPDGTSSTVYRCGTLIDLCLGPHIPHTGRVKALKLLKNSSAYFKGDAANAVLQRIYGVSFPDAARMKAHLQALEDAARRDHRRVGKDQQLFFFHDLSPGSAFFLPHGTRIYNRLVEYIRAEYVTRGYTEVITPNMYNVNLWKTSGHWENYKENMFVLDLEKETFALKPMNCPGHCLMFAHRERSYRELPLRLADFGVLHRNELSGALGGLTRVRRFQQDDAHIFCRPDQVADEIRGAIAFMEAVYGVFGFSFTLALSTRPEKYLGSLDVWNAAEAQLQEVLEKSGHPWVLNPGDGAFYGPKIDVTIQDAHKRRIQCATIQLDFQLPIRFGLEYRVGEQACDDACEHASSKEDVTRGMERPIIVHRAILGSIERMFAILTEHFAGNWPFWLSPRQVMVVPVSHAFDAYAQRVQLALQTAGLYADADLSDATLNKRIRNAEVGHHSYIVVVGAREQETASVNVRKADADGRDVVLTLDDALLKFRSLAASKTLVHHF